MLMVCFRAFVGTAMGRNGKFVVALGASLALTAATQGEIPESAHANFRPGESRPVVPAHVRVHADGRVSVEARGASLEALLEELAEHSGLTVRMSDGARNRPVDAGFSHLTLEETLERLLAGTSHVLVRASGPKGRVLDVFMLGTRDVGGEAAVSAVGFPTRATVASGEPISDAMDAERARELVRMYNLEGVFEKAARGYPLSESERERVYEFFAGDATR